MNIKNPYDIYLGPELSKFRKVSWVNKFFKENPDINFDKYKLPDNRTEFIKKFASKITLDDFVEGLDEKTRKNLSKLLSNWRKNGVYDIIEQLEDIKRRNPNYS